jgi:hypothetical protein
MHRRAILANICKEFGVKKYLEIGVATGGTIRSLPVKEKFGVDPHVPYDVHIKLPFERSFSVRTWFRWQDALRPLGFKPFEMDSHDFFNKVASRYGPFDLVFIDGMHVREYVYDDAINALKHLSEAGLVCFHDTAPRSFEGTKRLFIKGEAWFGDAWKAIPDLYKYDKRLHFVTWMDGNWDGSGDEYPDHLTFMARLPYERKEDQRFWQAIQSDDYNYYDHYLRYRDIYLNRRSARETVQTLREWRSQILTG